MNIADVTATTVPVIPIIEDAKLLELSTRIRPLIDRNGVLFEIEPPRDLRRIAFAWSPVVLEPAKGLEELIEIPTFHTYGAPMYFKPTIAEVLAQIPVEYLNETVAFCVYNGPETADDLNRQIGIVHKGFHMARTRLYKKASKPSL